MKRTLCFDAARIASVFVIVSRFLDRLLVCVAFSNHFHFHCIACIEYECECRRMCRITMYVYSVFHLIPLEFFAQIRRYGLNHHGTS